jgi:hypothetical protein
VVIFLVWVVAFERGSGEGEGADASSPLSSSSLLKFSPIVPPLSPPSPLRPLCTEDEEAILSLRVCAAAAAPKAARARALERPRGPRAAAAKSKNKTTLLSFILDAKTPPPLLSKKTITESINQSITSG